MVEQCPSWEFSLIFVCIVLLPSAPLFKNNLMPTCIVCPQAFVLLSLFYVFVCCYFAPYLAPACCVLEPQRMTRRLNLTWSAAGVSVARRVRTGSGQSVRPKPAAAKVPCWNDGVLYTILTRESTSPGHFSLEFAPIASQ